MGVSRYSSFILGLLFLVIQGCAGVGPDLEKAKEQNTEQAYLAFIEKYQDQPATSEQIKEVRKAIILIKFTEAQKKNTLEEEVVDKMAPVGHSEPIKFMSSTFQPVAEDVGSASKI